MKINKNDFEFLKKIMMETLDKAGRENLIKYKKQLESDERVRDLEMRFRWDIFWNTERKTRLEFLDGARYLRDAHIDTALKKIVNNYMEIKEVLF